MMRIFILLMFSFITFAYAANITKWALLVAGSNGYYNYRHQADICHAYKIFHDNGFPDSNIIVMMYDDIANNLYNPYPGVIVNSPWGINLYEGVAKDYTGDAVTPENFLAVLSGNTSVATGRVIPSSPDNDIFIYFADHGGPGLIAFPNDVLYSHQLIDLLGNMYRNNQYHSIVFYLEACESGSMFNLLLPRLTNVYAITAAAPDQASWAAYCDNNVFNTCLGDVFSVNFLQNSNGFQALVNETLYRQFQIVRNKTTTSRVCAYGDLTIWNKNLSHYLVWNTTGYPQRPNLTQPDILISDVANARDHKVQFLVRQYNKTSSRQQKKILGELGREYYQNEILEKKYGKYIPANTGLCYPTEYVDSRCMQKKITAFIKEHGALTESFFKYARVFGAECIYKLQ